MDQYYYLDAGNQQQGPVDAGELTKCGVTAQTMVWKQGMSAWQTAGSVSELNWIFPPAAATPPPPPPIRAQTPPPVNGSVPPPADFAPVKPDNMLVWSILATVLCCVPSGIVAIVYANKVNNLWLVKDYTGAHKAAQNAKIWCFVSLGLGILAFIIALIGGFLGAILDS